MGLQNQLNDVSSGSIPLLLLAQIATYFNYLRSFLHSLRLSRFQILLHPDPSFFSSLGSGLAALIFLSDHLSHPFFTYSSSSSDDDDAPPPPPHNDACVFCQNNFTHGDQVRMLPCRHVFHRRCFDGWLHHLNFNCPLCRSPLLSDERVALTEARVGRQLVSWFSMR